MTEDEMVGCHHWLNGHEFEQALGDGKGRGSLACLQSMGSQRVRHDLVTERLQQHTLLVGIQIGVATMRTSLVVQW